MPPKTITSPQNPEIKTILQLQEKARARKKLNLFVVEGVREIQLAIEGSYSIKHVYIQPEIASIEFIEFLEKQDISMSFLSLEVYQKIAYRNSTEGAIGLFETKTHNLQDLHFTSKNPIILIAESPEKPGNIGALLRTADASGIDAVIITNPQTDLYNPNVIRSSIGCVFTVSIATGTNEDVLDFIKQYNFQSFAAVLSNQSVDYLTQNYTKNTAIIVGTESIGLSDFWLQQADKQIIIPMRGKIDSMNVSVSAAILIFEAIRQRA
jgi:TrmH family RNA methyltransferase